MNAHQIILRPLWTEKTTLLKDDRNQVAFVVHPSANKIQVKRAIQDLFDVQVEQVRIICQHGKDKRMGRFLGRRPDWKKAYVKLAAGASIDFFEGV